MACSSPAVGEQAHNHRCAISTHNAHTHNTPPTTRAMLEEGVYLAPSQFEAGFTGLQHTEADIDATIEAAKRAFKRI